MMNGMRKAVCGVALIAASVANAESGSKSELGIEIPKDQKAFFERLHHSNQQEVQLGQLAQQKSQNPQVKQFAQMMVSDHQQADQQLMTMAQENKMKLGQPKPSGDKEKKLMNAEKANMEKLRALDGQAFDSAFMATMLSNHDMTLAKLQMAQQQFTEPQVTSLVQQLQPKIEQHRQQAYDLLGQLRMGTMGTGGSGSSDPMMKSHDKMNEKSQDPMKTYKR